MKILKLVCKCTWESNEHWSTRNVNPSRTLIMISHLEQKFVRDPKSFKCEHLHVHFSAFRMTQFRSSQRVVPTSVFFASLFANFAPQRARKNSLRHKKTKTLKNLKNQIRCNSKFSKSFNHCKRNRNLFSKVLSGTLSNFFSWPEKVSNWSVLGCHVSRSKCWKFVLRSACYSYLCFLRCSVRVLRLSVDVRAGKHVSEDVVGREWLKEETWVSCRLGHRQTLLP
jgi:hypothetical protein